MEGVARGNEGHDAIEANRSTGGDTGNVAGANRLPSLSSLPFPPRPSGMSISSLLGSNEPGTYEDLASRQMPMQSASNVANEPGALGQPTIMGRVNLPPPLSFDPALDRRRQNLEPNHARAEDALPRPKVRSGSNSPNYLSSQDANTKKEKKRHHHHHHHHVATQPHSHHHLHHHHHHRTVEDLAGKAPKTLEEMTPLPDHKPQLIVHNTKIIDALKEMKTVQLGSHVYEGKSVSLPRLEGRENALISIRIPERFVGHTDAMDKRRIWGTDVYTDDSDPVCILKHVGKRPDRPRQDVIITFRVLPPLVEYKGSLRHDLKSRTWNVQHDGMSIMVETVDFVTIGRAEERGGEMAKKRIRNYSELNGRGLHTQWKPTLEKRSKVTMSSPVLDQNVKRDGSNYEVGPPTSDDSNRRTKTRPGKSDSTIQSKLPMKRLSRSPNSVGKKAEAQEIETKEKAEINDKEAEPSAGTDVVMNDNYRTASYDSNDRVHKSSFASDKGDAHGEPMHDALPAMTDETTKTGQES